MNILEATKLYFLRYADFSGRSRRSEFWWAYLSITIIGAIATAILGDMAFIWSLAVLVPNVALCIRRLHDVGKSGWWYLIGLVPLVGPILLLIWACKDSTEDNEWGSNPKDIIG